MYVFFHCRPNMRFILAFLLTSLTGMALTEGQQAPFWLAKVKVKCEDAVHNCLGAIIEDQFLITTASCVTKCDDSERVIKISVSEYSANDDKQFGRRVKATEVTVHPEYSLSETQNLHDIALVKFRCPNFELSKVSLNDSCSKDIALSVITVNETSGTYQTFEASVAGKKKKCRQAYDKYDDSQACIIASVCSDKSDSLIADEQHDVLYGFSVYASECDNRRASLIAALELCNYHEWITNKTTTG